MQVIFGCRRFVLSACVDTDVEVPSGLLQEHVLWTSPVTSHEAGGEADQALGESWDLKECYW